MRDMLGFKFPSEHGLISFWTATIFISLLGVFLNEFSSFGLIYSLGFSVLIIFSYREVKRMIKSSFQIIAWLQITLIGLYTLGGLIIFYSHYLLFLLGIFGVLVSSWAIFANRTQRHDYNELGIGALIVTFLFPLIYELTVGIANRDELSTILAIWWLFGGIANATTIRVGSMRNKIPHKVPLYRTIFFSITMVPLILLGLLHPIFMLAIIEPSIQNFIQWQNQTIMERGRSIRKVGLGLVLSLIVAVIMVSIGIIVQFT